MHTIEISNFTTINFPEHLGEYTNQQYLFFCELLALFQSDHISYDEFRIRLTYKLMNMVHSKGKLNKEETATRNENIQLIAQFVDDLFVEKIVDDTLIKTLNLSFVDNKIPSFKYNGVTYYGPENVLLNISFGEFLEAITHFNAFSKSASIDALNKLVATLYRPRKSATKHNKLTNYDGDIREIFYSSNISSRAADIVDLPIHIKIGVKLFFEACINFITTAENVDVLGNEIDLTPLFQKGPSNSEKGIGMLNVLFSLSESNVFGNKKETEKELYWTILLKLYQNHLDVERQIKQQEDAKHNGV